MTLQFGKPNVSIILPLHATEYHKQFASDEFQKFLKEYLELCERHQLCVAAYESDVSIAELTKEYKDKFTLWQNCHCPACEMWWTK